MIRCLLISSFNTLQNMPSGQTMNDLQMMKMHNLFDKKLPLSHLSLLCSICFLFLLCTPQSLSAQRFNAGFVLGLNASQIDGDNAAGYNKLGLSAGVRATTYLTDKADLSFDILYSQRGSQSEFNLGANFIPFKIKVNYIEVPILFNYKDWLVEGEDDVSYYKITISGGVAYSRLFQTEIDDGAPTSSLIPLQDFFKKNDVSLVIGAAFNITEHIGVMVRWTRSVTPIYRAGDSVINAPSFVGKFLTFHTFYMF